MISNRFMLKRRYYLSVMMPVLQTKEVIQYYALSPIKLSQFCFFTKQEESHRNTHSRDESNRTTGVLMARA